MSSLYKRNKTHTTISKKTHSYKYTSKNKNKIISRNGNNVNSTHKLLGGGEKPYEPTVKQYTTKELNNLRELKPRIKGNKSRVYSPQPTSLQVKARLYKYNQSNPSMAKELRKKLFNAQKNLNNTKRTRRKLVNSILYPELASSQNIFSKMYQRLKVNLTPTSEEKKTDISRDLEQYKEDVLTKQRYIEQIQREITGNQRNTSHLRVTSSLHSESNA